MLSGWGVYKVTGGDDLPWKSTDLCGNQDKFVRD